MPDYLLRVTLHKGTRFARVVFGGAEAPPFHRTARAEAASFCLTGWRT